MEQDQIMGTGMGLKKKSEHQDRGTGPVFEESRISTQVKLAGLWATVMFMYIYVDIIGFFEPGVIEDILVGKVWVFEITQTWMLLSVMLMTIPALMVYLSLALPAKANRYVNIGLGAIYIFIAFGTAVGEVQAYYIFGSVVEVVLLSQIIWFAWKWPRAPRHIAVMN